MMFLLLVTVISTALAAVMGIVAWRIAREEAHRSQARIAALAAEIHGADSLPLRPVANDLELRTRPASTSGGDLFSGAGQAHASRRWPAVLAAGVFVVAAAGALIVVLSGGPAATTHAANEPLPAAAPPAAPTAPLELVALGHERDGDRLIVRGVVRNPPSGAAVDRLTAVVFVFNRDGGFLTSGRVMIEPSGLRPGGESIFVVTIPGAGDVGRYRVSFRTEDRIVPHVDRRVPVQAKL
jgi:flagellar basal body-associated protein FliL